MFTELVQLIVSQAEFDLEVEVQRYGMKKNTLTVDAIMLEDELSMRQHQKTIPKQPKSVSENRTAEISFILNFEFSLVWFGF